MDQEKVLEELIGHFRESGFNIALTVDPHEYNKTPGITKNIETLFSETNSVILVGFGGNNFWQIFQGYLKRNPEFKINNIDLIDNYSVIKFNEASKILDKYRILHKFVFPFGENALDLNFLRLGELAGAGVPSLLGILLHPVYGPWISLRGAILMNLKLEDYSSPISDFAPCPSCDKPCIPACPAHTVSVSGWDWDACMRFRLSDTTCAATCASRRACPWGKEQQYLDEQLEYHHKFVLKSARDYFNQNP